MFHTCSKGRREPICFQPLNFCQSPISLGWSRTWRPRKLLYSYNTQLITNTNTQKNELLYITFLSKWTIKKNNNTKFGILRLHRNLSFECALETTHIPPLTNRELTSMPARDRFKTPSDRTTFRPLKPDLQKSVMEGIENSWVDRETMIHVFITIIQSFYYRNQSDMTWLKTRLCFEHVAINALYLLAHKTLKMPQIFLKWFPANIFAFILPHHKHDNYLILSGKVSDFSFIVLTKNVTTRQNAWTYFCWKTIT